MCVCWGGGYFVKQDIADDMTHLRGSKNIKENFDNPARWQISIRFHRH